MREREREYKKLYQSITLHTGGKSSKFLRGKESLQKLRGTERKKKKTKKKIHGSKIFELHHFMETI